MEKKLRNLYHVYGTWFILQNEIRLTIFIRDAQAATHIRHPSVAMPLYVEVHVLLPWPAAIVQHTKDT